MKLIYEENIHPSWKSFLTKEHIHFLQCLEQSLPNNINPEPKNVLRFLKNDLNSVKCIIIGQDPYPALPKEVDGEKVYIATGRSFEIGTLTSWNCKFAQHSLKNMIRLIYKTYYNELISYEDCKKKIENGTFPIVEPLYWYENLEKQGVLFLNKTLSCEQGKPLSHKELWHDFSIDLIKFISTINKDIFWFLWGGEARSLKKYILFGHIYETEHPRLYNTNKKDSFLNSNCFKDTKNIINWLGIETV